MFLITYKKKNGELIYRKRMSVPCGIGQTTSMGWKVIDIKQNYKGKYVSLRDYAYLCQRDRVFHHYKLKIRTFLKKYASGLALIILIPLYLIK